MLTTDNVFILTDRLNEQIRNKMLNLYRESFLKYIYIKIRYYLLLIDKSNMSITRSWFMYSSENKNDAIQFKYIKRNIMYNIVSFNIIYK